MKPVLVYAALVGLPLAGLAAVLHAGRGLQAPADVGGAWRLLPIAERPGYDFTVFQSGTHVELTLGGTDYRGVFRGDSIVARSTTEIQPRACRTLRAFVDTAARPMRMTLPPDECGPGSTAVRIEGLR